MDAGEFFATVLGAADPIDRLKSEAALLKRKRRQPPQILALEAERTGEETTERVDLSELDELRVRDPRAAIRRAKVLVTRIDGTQLPMLLGVYASACRLLGRNDEAQLVLGRALELAIDLGDTKVLATLYQRASYLAYSRAELEEALELSERATLTYVQCADLVGVGKTLVDQGIWHGMSGHSEAEVSAFRSALDYLPEDTDQLDILKNRIACLMNLGIAYRKCGDLRRAARFAELASRNAKDAGPEPHGKIAWLQASIAREAGHLEEAERSYAVAIETLQPISPLEAALCALELIRVKLSLGRTAEAYRSAKEMAALIEPMQRHSRIAAAALTDLIRCALTGRGLSAAFLDKVAKNLEQGRTQKAASQATRSRH